MDLQISINKFIYYRKNTPRSWNSSRLLFVLLNISVKYCVRSLKQLISLHIDIADWSDSTVIILVCVVISAGIYVEICLKYYHTQINYSALQHRWNCFECRPKSDQWKLPFLDNQNDPNLLLMGKSIRYVMFPKMAFRIISIEIFISA